MARGNLLQRNHAATRLVDIATQGIASRYGTNTRRGKAWLPYHNADHSIEVHDVAYALAQQLSRSGRIDANDVPLVRIAAAFHDWVQTAGSGDNERLSAKAAIDAMARHGGL